MRVVKVQIENFKRFERLELELRSLDCLVGANNSGKTTLLQALALFDFCVHHCLNRRNGHFEVKKRTIAPEDFYVLPVTHPMDLWFDRKSMSGGKQRRIRVSVTFDTGDVVTATVKLDFNRYGVSIDVSDDSPGGLERLTGLRIAYLPVFSMFLPREERRLTAAIEDELARGRVNSVIRNLILELRNRNELEALVAVLRRSFTGLEDLRIEWDEVTDRYIAVTYQEQGRAREFDIFSAGSGFQQFLYLFGFIQLRRPTLVMLDEPDVHLHGSLQGVLLEELNRLVDDGRQVLFATHSRELIARVGPENIVSLDSGGASRLRVAFDVYDTLDRLGSIDPTQLAMIQAYRRVVIVEDRSDRDLLSIYCRRILGEERWQRVERRIAFCFTKGNPWKLPDIGRLYALLQQVIAVGGQAVEVFVIADRDYHADPETLEAELSRQHAHVRWHVWRRTEIENYLLELSAIRRLIRGEEGEPVLFEPALEAEFHRLVESCRDRANDGLAGAFDEIKRLKKEPRDAATMSRLAREFLSQHWNAEKLSLADAKEVVLPGLKRWLQDNGYGQFSDKKLAETMTADDFPTEMHDLASRLVAFAGL